jgi:hypothetical protein
MVTDAHKCSTSFNKPEAPASRLRPGIDGRASRTRRFTGGSGGSTSDLHRGPRRPLRGELQRRGLGSGEAGAATRACLGPSAREQRASRRYRGDEARPNFALDDRHAPTSRTRPAGGVEHRLRRRAPRHEHGGWALRRCGVRGGGRDGARPHLGENTCRDEADRVGGARSLSALALRLPAGGRTDPHRNAEGEPKQAHPGTSRTANFEPNPAPSRAGQGRARHRLELQAPWDQESSHEPRLVSRRHAGDLGHGHPRRRLTRSRRLHPIFGRRGNRPTHGGSYGKN